MYEFYEIWNWNLKLSGMQWRIIQRNRNIEGCIELAQTDDFWPNYWKYCEILSQSQAWRPINVYSTNLSMSLDSIGIMKEMRKKRFGAPLVQEKREKMKIKYS